jgi:hypothetical protein
VSEVIQYYDDISDRTIALLLQQFKTKEAFTDFIAIIADQIQQLESVFKENEELTWIETAFGAQLDGLGEIIGCRRAGLNDEDYRDFLQFCVLLNRSAGEPEFLITALITLTNSTFVRLYEVFPASCFGHINGLDIPDNLLFEMDNLAIAGVKFMYVSQTDGLPFSFDPVTIENDGLGFAWINGSGGLETDDAGEFAWALQD